jgi:hypothetical protein
MKVRLICKGSGTGIPLPSFMGNGVGFGTTYFALYLSPNKHAGYVGGYAGFNASSSIYSIETNEVDITMSVEDTQKWWSLHGQEVSVSISASIITGNTIPTTVKITQLIGNKEESLYFNTTCVPDSFLFSLGKIEFKTVLTQMEEVIQ